MPTKKRLNSRNVNTFEPHHKMAPLLGSNWVSDLSKLPEGWNGDGGSKITQAAMDTLSSFAVVPTSSGGIQLEVHRDGFDIEIEIGANGKLESALISLAKLRAT